MQLDKCSLHSSIATRIERRKNNVGIINDAVRQICSARVGNLLFQMSLLLFQIHFHFSLLSF